MAIKLALEPIMEAEFCSSSYGFRPGRRTQDAIEEVRHFINPPISYEWVIEGDVEDCFLEPSSHCQRVHGGGVEEAGFGLWDQYSQAFSASVADVEGLQFAALDTLQHGLAGDAEDAHGVDDRDVAGVARLRRTGRGVGR